MAENNKDNKKTQKIKRFLRREVNRFLNGPRKIQATIIGNDHVVESERQKYCTELRKRNDNHTFTLITNNCIGGVIYHNLGEQFRSPTINLFISGDEYLPFVKGIREYLSETTELVEVINSGREYPVGKLHAKDSSLPDITVYFQHYDSFEEARNKWHERCKRVNWEDISFIWEFYEGLHNYKHLLEFDSLNIKKKIILHKEDCSIKNAFVVNEGEVTPGKILEYEAGGIKRYLDQFDYVEFLN